MFSHFDKLNSIIYWYVWMMPTMLKTKGKTNPNRIHHARRLGEDHTQSYLQFLICKTYTPQSSYSR